jgi:hypothetical protein
MKLNRSTIKYQDFLFITGLAILAYWPVSFMIFSVKNDAINYFMAMRYNTCEAIQSGYFPLWSPYINMGYPLHADMQSGTWNPVVLVLSLIRKYDIYWLQVETILTVIIAGFSFYKLLSHFKLNRVVLLAGSAAYMLNGYITDSGQFLNWLYAAAYLPLVILYAIRSFEQFRVKDAFLLGLSFSLMLLSAYPADFILLAYVLIAYFIFSVFRYKKVSGLWVSLKKCSRQSAIASVSFLIICLPAILSYIPFLASIRRGAGVELDVALSNSLSPVNFISFLTPWPTLRLNWQQYTDPLIRNCYAGLIPLIFLLVYFRHSGYKTFVQKFFTGIFLFFLVFSLGKAGGLRVLSYYTLPLMDSFRHPANAKLFFLFAGQLLAFLALDKYLKDPGPYRKTVLQGVNIILIIAVLMLLTGLVKSRMFNPAVASDFSMNRAGFKALFDSLGFYDLLFLNALLISLVLLITRRLLLRNRLQSYLLLLICSEMILAAQLMLPLTYFRSSSPKTAQSIINHQPKGYPVPDINTSVRELSEDGMNYFNEIGCLNPYNKKPGRSDYIITPANLSWQLDFWEDTLFRKKILEFPLAYFADTVYRVQDKAKFIASNDYRKVAVSDVPADLLNNTNPGAGPIRFTSFRPGRIGLHTDTEKGGLLVLMQNKYPGWEARVNGRKVPVIITNRAFMGILVPPGVQEVEFRYKATGILYIAVFSFIFLITGIIYFSRMKNNSLEQKAD